jgi:hypothetical protein
VEACAGCCFSKALFIVGEFGVNDYTFIWMSGKTEDEVRSYVPKVVETIVLTVEVINKPTTLLFPVRAAPCFLLRSSLFILQQGLISQ